MLRHTLGPAHLEVSHLGFGCVKLTTHADRRDAIRTLETAFSCGITHFDVARAYGFGRAEGILGQFLAGKRDRVTVATKFGIQPPSGIAGNRWAVNLAKKALQPFPGLLRRAKQRGSNMVQSGAFTPASMIESLETSLKELRTDYVDLLLLHEANIGEAQSEALLGALRKQVDRGTVRTFGIASAFSKLNGHISEVPVEYSVLQFDDNARIQNLKHVQSPRRALITHSIFQPAESMRNIIAANHSLAQGLSREVGADLTDPSAIGSLLLHYALHSNPTGVVLFASSNPQRITVNTNDANSTPFTTEQLRAFAKFAQGLPGPS